MTTPTDPPIVTPPPAVTPPAPAAVTPPVPAAVTPPAPVVAPPPVVTPPPAVTPPAPPSGGTERERYLEAELQRSIAQRDTLKEQARISLEAKTAADAAAEAERKGRQRTDVRGHFVDAILARVPEGKRADVELSLAGLRSKGEFPEPSEIPENATAEQLKALAAGGAAVALTTLVDRYPGWFAGGAAPTVNPAGPGTGPLPADWMSLTPEQRRDMSEEDFAKNYGSGRARNKRKTSLG